MRVPLTVAPKKGPSIYSVAAFARRTIPAAAGGAIGTVGPVEFQWPRPLVVTGVKLVTGDVTGTAALSFRIQDETFSDLIFDWSGQNQFIDAVAANGLDQARWLPLQRPVQARDSWFITVGNQSAGDLTCYALLFMFNNGLQ